MRRGGAARAGYAREKRAVSATNSSTIAGVRVARVSAIAADLEKQISKAKPSKSYS